MSDGHPAEESKIGHNSKSVSAIKLTSFIQRVERLRDERKNLSEDERAVFSEAKCDGFDPRVMREVIRLRAMDPSAMAERRDLIDIYLEALGA